MTRAPRWRRRLALVAIVCTATAVTAGLTSVAFVTDHVQSGSSLTAGHIFPGTRSSSAFSVQDASGSGAALDRSSPLAFAGDGLTLTTGAWATGFASSRYFQLDLNAPLAGGIATAGMTFNLAFASANPSGTTCIYADVRRASTDVVQATYGSAGSPLACVSGSTPTTISQAIAGASTTDLANDLRIRIYARDSAAAGALIDEATVTGATPYASFTLYPVRTADDTGAVPVTAPWSLQGP